MKALITGAAGFLGHHVANTFHQFGWDVTGFDLEKVAAHDTRWLQGDLTDADSVEQALRGMDAVAHIGAIGDVYLAGERPPLAASVNVVGTANVIESARRHGVRMVYASTWEVYGEPRWEPIDETHPTLPDHPYSITKLAGEALTMAATNLTGLSALALRLGTAYGSGLRPNSVFRVFIDRARRGEPITIQGDGTQGRQFTHAKDIARAFEMAARSEVSGVALNIVAPEVTSIGELANVVVERFPTEILFGDPRPGDVPPAEVSAQQAEELLGWKAEVSFVDGMNELMSSVSSEN